MKTLWQNGTDYTGVELTPKEAALIAKVLGNLSFNQRKVFLSDEEETLYCELYAAFTA